MYTKNINNKIHTPYFFGRKSSTKLMKKIENRLGNKNQDAYMRRIYQDSLSYLQGKQSRSKYIANVYDNVDFALKSLKNMSLAEETFCNTMMVNMDLGYDYFSKGYLKFLLKRLFN